MKTIIVFLFVILLGGAQLAAAGTDWYSGDERCKPPVDDGSYSAPYDAKEHPGATFPGADKPGWGCSYQKENGVIVHYGNSMTPQQQWLAIWSTGANAMD